MNRIEFIAITSPMILVVFVSGIAQRVVRTCVIASQLFRVCSYGAGCLGVWFNPPSPNFGLHRGSLVPRPHPSREAGLAEIVENSILSLLGARSCRKFKFLLQLRILFRA